MRFSALTIIALLTFSGCAEKGAFDLFKMDKAHERAVEQLRTDSIVLSMETKAMISSLYLNPVYPDRYKDGEYFISAIYYSHDTRKSKERTLEDAGYTLTLNGTAPLSIEELKEENPIRAMMPVQNNWNRYYLVRFKNFEDGALKLRLENNQTGSVVLSYQKGK